MKLLPTLFCAALLSALALAAPAAQAQVNVNINTAPPAWGPPVPQGTQFYYIPEIDGYYDLYAQQYIVFQNGQWVALPALNGYDPYAFHPVVLDYRGRQPWVYVGAHRDRYPRRAVVVQPRRVVVVQPRPVIVAPRRGLPPGQAKKLYREGYREGRNDNGNGHSRGRRD